MVAIITARQQFGIASAAEYHVWLLARSSVQLQMTVFGVTADQIGAPVDTVKDAPPAIAYVNHSRWVADCPTDGCGGAVTLLRMAPFLCGNCLNVEIGHRYRPVVWPLEEAAIEDALFGRLLPEHVNWRPGETVDELLAENERNRPHPRELPPPETIRGRS